MNDKFKTMIVFLSLSISSSLILGVFTDSISDVVRGETINVPEDYPKISYAVENASEGDTILVGPGTYEEEVIVTKPLTIQSTDGAESTIVSNVGYTAFKLESKDVTISGFTIRDAQNGIFIKEYDGCTLTGNILTRNYRGILIHGYYDSIASNHTITNNNITDNDAAGIYLGGHAGFCTVSNNILTKNDASGITVYHGSEHNTIENNDVYKNGDNGIYLTGSGYSMVRNNEVYDNDVYGIHILYSYHNELRDNAMSGNQYNFRIVGDEPILEEYDHDIDTSNLIEGKPMYYWVGEKDKEIPSDAGFVGLINCENIVVSGVNVTDTGSGILFVYTNDSSISDVEVWGNIFGIELLYSDHNTLQNIYGSRNGDAAIRIEDSKENVIQKNTLYKNGYHYGDGIELYRCSNHTITENTIEHNGAGGINLILTEFCTVKNNTASHNRNGHGINVGSNSEHNLIRDNTVVGNDHSNVYLSASRYNKVMNNVLDSSSDGSGIQLQASTFNLIKNNQINDNDVYGVYLYLSDGNDVMENDIESNYARGVHIADSEYNTVGSNYISDNREGIRIESRSENNGVINNTILNSQWYGLYLWRAHKNEIRENIVYKTDEYYGINLKECEYNDIYWNDFMDDVKDAYDDGTNNWSADYPDGGNYWSNYSGVDEKSGVDQDQPGSDGFGDIPYTIAGGDNLDHYPFMEPIQGISNTKPSASFTVDPYTGNLSTDFVFDASESSDNEDESSQLLVRWDWEDDGTYDTTWLTMMRINKNYSDYGTYDVRLQVKDTGGLTDSMVKQVYVYDKPSAPQNFQCRPADGKVSLSWDEPADDGGTDIESYAIYKGTGSQAVQFYKEVDERTFSYTDTQVTNGVTYHYGITAVSERGEGSRTELLSATPEEGLSPYIPPIADFESYIMQGLVDYGMKLHLYDNSTPGDGELVNHTWDISNGRNLTLYGEKILVGLPFGTHNVTYTVLDSNGESDSIEKDIVLERPKGPQADFTWNPYYPEEHDMVWMVDKSIPGDNPIINRTYEFNDGEFYVYGGGWFGASPGVYSVNLTVSDGYLTDYINKEIFVAQSISHDLTPGEASLIEDYGGNVSIGIEVESNTELNLFEFPGDPTNGTLSGGSQHVGKCYGITINDTDLVIWPIVFRMYYKDDQLDGSDVTEDSLSIYYWDEENQTWVEVEGECEVNTTDQDGYSGYVGCELYHLTIFSLVGSDPSPVAEAGEDIEIEKGEKAVLDGSESSDNAGIVNYTWEFEYDGSKIRLYGERVEFRFEKAGEYEVELKVTDSSGSNDADSMTVRVTEEQESLGLTPWILITIVAITVMLLIVYVLYRRSGSKKSLGRNRRTHH